jgi:hypothetical protein
MGRINSLAQERQWISGHHMHNLLPRDQECSLWPWSKCQPHAQSHVWRVRISGYLSDNNDNPTCWFIDQISRSHSRKSLGECQRLVCLCRFRGPRHTRRNSVHSRATIPKRWQCKDWCRSREDPFPHMAKEHDIQIPSKWRAMLPSARWGS